MLTLAPAAEPGVSLAPLNCVWSTLLNAQTCMWASHFTALTYGRSSPGARLLLAFGNLPLAEHAFVKGVVDHLVAATDPAGTLAEVLRMLGPDPYGAIPAHALEIRSHGRVRWASTPTAAPALCIRARRWWRQPTWHSVATRHDAELLQGNLTLRAGDGLVCWTGNINRKAVGQQLLNAQDSAALALASGKYASVMQTHANGGMLVVERATARLSSTHREPS